MDDERNEGYSAVAAARRDGIAVGLIGAMVLAGLIALPHLPGSVPVHWNAAGHVNGWGSPLFAVLFPPALALGLWLSLLLLPTVDPRRRHYAQFSGTYRLLRLLVVALIAVMDVVTLGHALGSRVNVPAAAALSISAMLLVLGNLLQRVRPTWFVGIRTPWTLSDDEVWRRTHRLGGRLFMLAALTPPLGLLAGPSTLLRLTAAAVLVPALAAVLYSYLLYSRLHRGMPSGPRP